MYAVIETGGKQYRVQAGDIVQVEKLEGDLGTSVKFEKILFLSSANAENAQVWLGKPHVSGASVQTEIVGQGRGEKILIIKMRRRKQYRRTQGHRQCLTQLLVTAVDNGAGNATQLDDTARKAKMATFQSHLAPKGLPHTPKTLGSRKRMAAAKAAGGATATSSKKTAAPATASAAKEAAPKAKKAPAKKAEGAAPKTKKTTKAAE
jgi:large subunit ribosomal protein L21